MFCGATGQQSVIGIDHDALLAGVVGVGTYHSAGVSVCCAAASYFSKSDCLSQDDDGLSVKT